MGGPNPTEKRRTRMPHQRAARWWPSSWKATRRPRPRTASTPLVMSMGVECSHVAPRRPSSWQELALGAATPQIRGMRRLALAWMLVVGAAACGDDAPWALDARAPKIDGVDPAQRMVNQGGEATVLGRY